MPLSRPSSPVEPLLQLDRLRLVDGIAAARHVSILPAALAHRIGLVESVAAEPDFSLYALFERRRAGLPEHLQVRRSSPVAAAMRIGARDLTRRFGDLVANDAISFEVTRGSIHAIVGGNGAGKTTLMRLLQGMEQPDEGTVLVDGAPVRLSGPAAAFAVGIGTVVDGVPEDALATTEETYGPLAAIASARDDANALRIVTALPCGLAAYVYTGDLERGWDFADRVEAGAVGVNVNDTSESQAPLGSWKLSGVGRELGRGGVEAFRESNHIKLRVRGCLPASGG